MNLQNFMATPRQPLSIPKNGSCPREGEGGIPALDTQQSSFIAFLPELTYLYPFLDEEHPEVPFILTVPSTHRHSQHCQGR